MCCQINHFLLIIDRSLRNAAEGEFPARVPSLQPEPKAKDATARVQEHLPPSCEQYFSVKVKKITFRTPSRSEVTLSALVLKINFIYRIPESSKINGSNNRIKDDCRAR